VDVDVPTLAIHPQSQRPTCAGRPSGSPSIVMGNLLAD
jgi:hypothetical protein